jgi:hypothetical protein
MQTLEATAKMMVADGKGLLAIDESTGTCNKRFAKWGIPQTAEAHRLYRELIVNTPGLSESISGAILYDETIRQEMDDRTPFAKALAARGIHSRHQGRSGGQRDGGLSRRKGYGRFGRLARSTWRSTRKWAHASRSGERSSLSAMGLRATGASRRTHTRWPAMPACVKRQALSRSSSRRS